MVKLISNELKNSIRELVKRSVTYKCFCIYVKYICVCLLRHPQLSNTHPVLQDSVSASPFSEPLVHRPSPAQWGGCC